MSFVYILFFKCVVSCHLHSESQFAIKNGGGKKYKVFSQIYIFFDIFRNFFETDVDLAVVLRGQCDIPSLLKKLT